jgi:hypothetical protein
MQNLRGARQFTGGGPRRGESTAPCPIGGQKRPASQMTAPRRLPSPQPSDGPATITQCHPALAARRHAARPREIWTCAYRPRPRDGAGLGLSFTRWQRKGMVSSKQEGEVLLGGRVRRPGRLTKTQHEDHNMRCCTTCAESRMGIRPPRPGHGIASIRGG